MHPFINQEVALAREADQRRRAERDRRVNAVVSRRPRRLAWLKLARFLRGAIRFQTARRTEMAKFMDVHSGFTGVTEEQLQEAHRRDLDIEAAEGVHFERAWLDPESGVVFCLSSGPSKEAVRRVHEKAGHPADEIYELPVEVV
jgi:Protein of unknown function (DUF4242)